MNSESRVSHDYEQSPAVHKFPGIKDDLFEACPVLEQGKASVAQCSPETVEELRRLAQSLALSAHTGRHVIAFCGVTGADHSELVCMRVAELLAFSFGYKVCVLDANPGAVQPTRMGWVTGSSSKTMQPSLAPSPKTQGALFLIERNQVVAPSLHSGTRSDLSHDRLSDLRRSFDYLLISAPRPRDNHFTGMAANVDGVILSVEAGVARRRLAMNAKQVIESAHGHLMGTVLTDRRLPIPQWLFKRLAI